MPAFRPKDVLRKAREAEKKGSLKEAAGQYAQVAATLLKRGNTAEAKTLYSRAMELSPGSPRLYVYLAACEMRLGNTEAAKSFVGEFISLTVAKGKTERYRPTFDAALAEWPALRLLFYEAILAIDRTTALPFLEMAKCWLEQKDEVKAKRATFDALKTKSHEPEVLSMLRAIFAGARQALDCLDRYEQGKLTRHELVSLLEDAGTHTDKTDDEEKSLQDLIKELEAEMGVNVEEVDSITPLVKEFRRRANPVLQGHSKSRMDIGLAFFEMGLIEDALGELRHIQENDPHYHEAQCLLGEVLFSEGSFMGAIEAFQRCLRDGRASEDVFREANYRLVQVYLRVGDGAKAKEILMTLDKKYPDYRSLRKLKSQMG